MTESQKLDGLLALIDGAAAVEGKVSIFPNHGMLVPISKDQAKYAVRVAWQGNKLDALYFTRENLADQTYVLRVGLPPQNTPFSNLKQLLGQ